MLSSLAAWVSDPLVALIWDLAVGFQCAFIVSLIHFLRRRFNAANGSSPYNASSNVYDVVLDWKVCPLPHLYDVVLVRRSPGLEGLPVDDSDLTNTTNMTLTFQS